MILIRRQPKNSCLPFTPTRSAYSCGGDPTVNHRPTESPTDVPIHARTHVYNILLSKKKKQSFGEYNILYAQKLLADTLLHLIFSYVIYVVGGSGRWPIKIFVCIHCMRLLLRLHCNTLLLRPPWNPFRILNNKIDAYNARRQRRTYKDGERAKN